MSLVSDIKLIRTDTTLDLSQKAEKGMMGIRDRPVCGLLHIAIPAASSMGRCTKAANFVVYGLASLLE